MANKRMGVEYNVSGFEVRGSGSLPNPDTPAPYPHQSANLIQEYRPDFRADIGHSSVQPFVHRVVDDVWELWQGGVGEGEPEMDRKKVR